MNDDPKSVEYYAAQVNAWLNTRFEHDRSLLTLSAGGVGLLITLISTTGVRSIESLILYIFALLSFILCLGALLWIFRRNAKHLEDVVQEKSNHDPLLAILDIVAITSFFFGVVFSAIIGVSTAVYSYQEKEHQMANEKSSEKLVFVRESVNGVSSMAPSGNSKFSVDGISKMNPNNSTPTQTPSSSPTPPASDSGDKK